MKAIPIIKGFISEFIFNDIPNNFKININSQSYQKVHDRLSIIYEKLYNPDKPESNFYELVLIDIDKAKDFADDINKQMIKHGITQLFIEVIKKQNSYIEYMREYKLNKILC